jgi:DNA-binding MarR family transcriptional regulator
MNEPFPTTFDHPWEESPGLLLWRATNAWQARQRAALQTVGLTHVQFVLLAVSGWLTRDGDALNQAELARIAVVDVNMTSQVLRALEAKKLITRTVHPADPRARTIALTDTGRELLDTALPLMEGVDREFFGDRGEQASVLLRGLPPNNS